MARNQKQYSCENAHYHRLPRKFPCPPRPRVNDFLLGLVLNQVIKEKGDLQERWTLVYLVEEMLNVLCVIDSPPFLAP